MKIARIYCPERKGEKKDLGFSITFNFIWFFLGNFITLIGFKGYIEGLGNKCILLIFVGLYLLIMQLNWLTNNLKKKGERNDRQ